MRSIVLVFAVLLPFVCVADVVVPIDKVETSVNIRSAPDTGSDVVGRLNRGDSLPLVGTGSGWHEVQLEGDTTGFISADWARIRPEEVTRESATDVAPADVAPVIVEAAAEDAAAALVEEVLEEAAEPVAEKVVEEEFEVVVEEVVEEEVAAVVEPDVAVSAAAERAPVPPGVANIKGRENFLVKFRKETEGGNSQVYDNGNQVGIGTTNPKQRLEVNGSIQIHEQNSSVAGLMITQSSGETGYIMHNRASTLTIGAGSQDRITVDREGNVGIGVPKPRHPLEMASGAHVTAGGVWTNSSSRERKENIAGLSTEQARAALMQLEPVLFNYRDDRGEEYVGFIAEEVPELVANGDRQSLSTMDIVAVLTKVVQAQQKRIEALEARLE
ncbi:MAG: SH3 domain-containing protein [Gammaproteobacteria bacterium]|nr:SH3 domain-containing protein [Gammaproteobacteria bacterium]MBT8109091.1 SH3 domain-containing protein [Gammaproteobacteria bacterium]NND46547.1 SH3 domain-containing protein [Woeseiaceae bacterium]NNL43794.1 SH3 domain-containing protein [Woeseiaceae bacterium]